MLGASPWKYKAFYSAASGFFCNIIFSFFLMKIKPPTHLTGKKTGNTSLGSVTRSTKSLKGMCFSRSDKM